MSKLIYWYFMIFFHFYIIKFGAFIVHEEIEVCAKIGDHWTVFVRMRGVGEEWTPKTWNKNSHQYVLFCKLICTVHARKCCT